MKKFVTVKLDVVVEVGDDVDVTNIMVNKINLGLDVFGESGTIKNKVVAFGQTYGSVNKVVTAKDIDKLGLAITANYFCEQSPCLNFVEKANLCGHHYRMEYGKAA